MLATPVLLDVDSINMNRRRARSRSLYDVTQIDGSKVGGLFEMPRCQHIFEDFEKDLALVRVVSEDFYRTCRFRALELFFFFVGVGSVNDRIVHDQMDSLEDFRLRSIQRAAESVVARSAD